MRTHFFVDNEKQVRRQVEITVFDIDSNIVNKMEFAFTQDNLVIETVDRKFTFSSVGSHKNGFKVELYLEEGSGTVSTRSKEIKGTKWFEVEFKEAHE